MNSGANTSSAAPIAPPIAAHRTTTVSSSIPAPAAPGVGLRGRLIGCAWVVEVLGHDATAPARYSVWRDGVGTVVGATAAPPADGASAPPARRRGQYRSAGLCNNIVTVVSCACSRARGRLARALSGLDHEH